MKNYYFLLVAAVFAANFQSCAPCTDPEVVKIPAADATPPTLRWEVAVLSQTPSGPISSYTPYDAPANSITVKSTDKVDVYLVARDEQSGIKKMSTLGGFGYTCSPAAGTAFIVDGILIEDETIFNKLTTCALKEWKISRKNLNVAFSCSPGATISNRIIGLTGKAENFKGGSAQISLTVNITD